MTDPAELIAALSCTLPPDGVDRRRVEAGAVFGLALDTSEIDGGAGMEYEDSDDVAQRLADFVLFERRCCSRLRYVLRFDPQRQRVALEITGDPEYESAVRAWVASARA